MSLDPWLAFTAATMVLLVIPGPTILLVVSYALGQGWRSALPISVGVALGDFTAMTLSMLGIGALLSASAAVFTVLKLAGAAYLIYLGIKLWRAGGRLHVEAKTAMATPGKMLGHAWLVTALNPKSITFFVAFLPQFLDTSGDVPRSDGHLRDNVPRPGFRQCPWLCARGLARPGAGAEQQGRSRDQQGRGRTIGQRRHRRGDIPRRPAIGPSKLSWPCRDAACRALSPGISQASAGLPR